MSTAQAQFNRADKLYHLSVKAFFVFTGVMLVLIAFQVAHLQGDFTKGQSASLAQNDKSTKAAQARLQKALEETQRQQVVTQNYIRCVASVLLKPVPERHQEDFDACGIPGVTDPSQIGEPNTNQGVNAPNQQSPAITPGSQSSTKAAPSNQPVAAGSPPDDSSNAIKSATPKDTRSTLDKIPVVGGFFHAIGL